VGPGVQKVKVGDRVVASFQIACGQCYYCKQGLATMCERTNTGVSATKLYGKRTSGEFSPETTMVSLVSLFNSTLSQASLDTPTSLGALLVGRRNMFASLTAM
jgi:threonine dehydrogenase-like Zn-dependent dehydrogenase